jgi:hypothetical protein
VLGEPDATGMRIIEIDGRVELLGLHQAPLG